MGYKRPKNGARQCPYCGVILDPGEKCDCRSIDAQLTGNRCGWCGSPIIGREFSIATDDSTQKICFRCNLAFQNLKKQREELKKTQW